VRPHTNARAKPSAIYIAPTSCPYTFRTPQDLPYAAHRALCSGAAGTGDPLKVEPTASHDLLKPKCRAITQLTLGRAPRSIGFGRIETNEPKGLASKPNGIAVQHLNLVPINRRGIRDRGKEGESEDETADHWRQLHL
jgi:hypothetical protein